MRIAKTANPKVSLINFSTVFMTLSLIIFGKLLILNDLILFWLETSKKDFEILGNPFLVDLVERMLYMVNIYQLYV